MTARILPRPGSYPSPPRGRMICPSCAYREADQDTGFCSVCTGQLSLFQDEVKACERCGAAERNSAGDCAPCQRARERTRQTGRPVGRPRIEAPCYVPGCTRPYHAAGYCRPHYLRHWRKQTA